MSDDFIENRTSEKTAEILGCCEMVVNNRVARYQTEGVKGLTTQAGRGRPPILSQQNPEHLQKVADEIKEHPNSVKTVVAVLEEKLNLTLHPETLKRFLKKRVSVSVVRPHMAQTKASGRGKGRKRKAVENCVVVILGRTDRFVFR